MNYSFKEFQRVAIARFLSFDKYNFIKENIYKCDVSKNIEYQKAFDSFYRVRRNEEWRKVFFEYFEKVKYNKEITFEEIVTYLYEKTGNIEASFSSKLLSTINNNMPIWDQYVLKNLNLEVEGKNKKEKLRNTIKLYNKIVEIENEKLKSNDVQESIKSFREYYPEYDFSDIKILDYMLWNTRNDEE